VNPAYLESARLLTRVAPLVLVDDTFALKGGTAINLFVRDPDCRSTSTWSSPTTASRVRRRSGASTRRCAGLAPA
jgi:hypothetical protein